MTFVAEPNLLDAVGLLFDVVGAVFLAKAIFFGAASAISLQAAPMWDDNPYLREAICEQRVDVRFGLPLLLAGFIVQLASGFVVLEFVFAVIVLLVLVVASASYFILRGRLIAKMVLKTKPALEDVSPAGAMK